MKEGELLPHITTWITKAPTDMCFFMWLEVSIYPRNRLSQEEAKSAHTWTNMCKKVGR